MTELVGKWFVRIETTGFWPTRARLELGEIVARVEEAHHSDQFLVRVEPVEGSPFAYPIHRVKSMETIERGFALFAKREEAEKHLQVCLQMAQMAQEKASPSDQEMN